MTKPNERLRICLLMIADFDFETRSNLYADLALELTLRQHEVCALAPSDKTEYAPYRSSVEQGVRVVRVHCSNLFNVGFLAKGIANLRLPWLVSRAMRRALPDPAFDLIISHTPPIFYAGLVRRLKRRCDCASYLILRDIFPQNAVDLGVLRNRWIIAWFRRVEQRLYQGADRIGCMSPGNIRYLRERSAVPESKLELLPNWKRIDPCPPRLEDGKALLAEWGLDGKFIAIFGGVLGVAQGLDFLLDIAKALEDLMDVRLLIIGEGNRRAHLANRVRNEGLANVQVREGVDGRRFRSLVANCDLGLISLARAFTIPNIPSKVLDYFEAAIPVLAAIDPHTDFRDLIEQSGSGFCTLHGDIEAFRDRFTQLYRQPQLRAVMGQAGRKHLENHLTVETAADRILGIHRPARR